MTRGPDLIRSFLKHSFFVLALFTWFRLPSVESQSAPGTWPMVNRDAGATRYSPLTQITPANVGRLKVAWIYHMRPAAPAGSAADNAWRPSEDQPLVIGDTMFVVTPYGRVVALDSATGREKWVFVIPGNDEASQRGAEY